MCKLWWLFIGILKLICTFAGKKLNSLWRQMWYGTISLVIPLAQSLCVGLHPNWQIWDRRHVHVFPRLRGARGKYSVAKVWLESHGQKQVEIYESSLSAKENDLLLRIINANWEYINKQLTKSFNGEKTYPKEIKLK